MVSKVLRGAVELASYNLAFFLTFRFVTIFLHGLMVRSLSSDVLGVINVRLTLLYWTSLMISHDSLRRACLGDEGKQSNQYWKKVCNLLWTAVPTAAIFGGFLGFLWVFILEKPSEEVTPYYSFCVFNIVLAVIVENLAEPLFSLGQAFLYAKLRAVIDTVTMITRIIFIILLMYLFPNYPAEAFSMGVLLGSTLFTILYYLYFYYHLHIERSEKEFPLKSLSDVLPSPVEGDWFLKEQVELLWSFFKQIFLKQVLVEGEKYVITMFTLLTFAEQGEYDAVTNIGIITAKMLLYPIEEASYLYFAKSVKRNVSVAKQDKSSFPEVVAIFRLLLRFMVVGGLFLILFSQCYSSSFLYIYGGDAMTGGTATFLFQIQGVNVLLLGVITVTEMYCMAAMAQDQVDEYNNGTAVIAVLYLVMCYVFTSLLGSPGLIFANCITIILRIRKAYAFLVDHFKGSEYRPLDAMTPGKIISLLLGAIFVLTYISLQTFGFSSHLLVGLILAMLTIVSLYFTEEKYVDVYKGLVKPDKVKE